MRRDGETVRVEGRGRDSEKRWREEEKERAKWGKRERREGRTEQNERREGDA